MKTFMDEGVTAETLERLKKLRPDSPRQWGKMNAHQMVCHLCDSFRLGLGERGVSAVSAGAAQRTVLKTIALRVPLPWPKGIETRPEADQEKGGTQPVEFTADVRNLVALVERFARRDRDFEFGVHPMFGAMTEWEWMRWGYLHADHHLRQFGV